MVVESDFFLDGCVLGFFFPQLTDETREHRRVFPFFLLFRPFFQLAGTGSVKTVADPTTYLADTNRTAKPTNAVKLAASRLAVVIENEENTNARKNRRYEDMKPQAEDHQAASP